MADTGKLGSFLPPRVLPTLTLWASTCVQSAVIAILAGGLALVAYRYTLAPTLTWEHHGADGGDFLAAAATLGIPHPPGYPLYTLLLHGWLRFWPAGDLAYRGNLLSAVYAALTISVLVMAFVTALRWPAQRLSGSCLVAGAVAALIFAFTPTFWSQAVITEVYTLNALFTGIVLWLLLCWRERPASPQLHLGLLGLAIGLGLGNHLTLALLVPLALWWLWRYRHVAPQWGAWLTGLSAFGLGLSIYLYLPWRAGTAPIDWGSPHTMERFWWVVSGQIYQHLVFGIEPIHWWERLQAWATLLREQFGLLGIGVAVFGLWQLDTRDGVLRWLTLGAFLLYTVYALGYDTSDSHVYLIPAYMVAALWLGGGVVGVLDVASKRWGRGAFLLAGMIACAPLWPLLVHLDDIDQRDLQAAAEFGTAALVRAEPDALLLVATDEPTFALWYYLYAEGRRPDLAVANVNFILSEFDWYWEVLERTHPQILPPDRTHLPLEQFLAYNIEERPVYLAEALEMELPYRRVFVDPLWKLETE